MDIYEFFRKEDAPFLTRQIEEFSVDALKEISIGHNTPLMLSAMIKLMPFMKNRIKLFVSTPDFLGYDKRAIDALKSEGIPVDINRDICTEGDIFLDCSANLLGRGSPKAVAELTQTGAMKYKQHVLDIPIVSIDDSKLKLLEDYLGTGEGFVRAFKEKINPDISGKHFVVWGYGKVGKGIVKSLMDEKCECSVIEVNKKAFAFARKKGVRIFHIEDGAEIISALNNAYCLVLGTGVKNVVSESPFVDTIKNAKPVLANMGAEDEFGDNFSKSEIANNKIALNFALFEPTRLKYLDPVFYAHNLCVKLFMEGKLKNGFNEFPKEYDTKIVHEWEQYWKEDISDVLEL